MKIRGIRIIFIERKILLCLSKIIILQPKFTKLRYYTDIRSLMGANL